MRASVTAQPAGEGPTRPTRYRGFVDKACQKNCMFIQSFQEIAMHTPSSRQLRQFYQPMPSRVPEWLHRLWLWF